MKNWFLGAFLLCAAVAWTACSDDGTENPAVQLAAPELEYEIIGPREVRVCWRPVEHADAYRYSVDRRAENTTLSCEATIDPLGAASCVVTVYAVSDDPSAYPDSEPSRITVSDTPRPEEAVIVGFESAALGEEGFIWGKPMAVEEDDTDWQGNPIRSNRYYGSLYREGEADLWTFYSDSGHTFDTWNGFVVSNHTDMETSGYLNDKSVYAGSGAEGSKQFAVGYYGAWTAEPYGIPVIKFETAVRPLSVGIANTTYVYRYFRDDVAEVRKPDYTLRITGVNGSEEVGEVSWLLAGGETIVEGWQTVDLSGLGEVTGLEFRIACEDVNAPLYFALDNLLYLK